MTARQLQLDFPRAAKLALLDQVYLPCHLQLREGKRHIVIEGKLVKLILRELDNFQRDQVYCWPSQGELMRRCSCSEHELQRGLRWLRGQGWLVNCWRWDQDQGKSIYCYAIQWTQVLSGAPVADLSSVPDAGRVPDTGTLGAPADLRGSGSLSGRAPPVRTPPVRGPTPPPWKGTPPPQRPTPPPQGGGAYEALTLKRTNPPPPTPSVAVAEGGGGGDLRSLFRGIGVERVESSVRLARERGIGAEQLRVAIATARANRSRLRCVASAVCSWLRSGDWPAKIEPLERIEARQVSAKTRRQERAKRTVVETESPLEGTWGPRLDALSDADICALVAGRPEEAFVRRSPRSLLYRDILLEVLEARGAG